jgi:hypothetical protein
LQVCNVPGYEYERKLHPDDLALNVQLGWKTRTAAGGSATGSSSSGAVAASAASHFSFVLKRNPDNSAALARRRVSLSIHSNPQISCYVLVAFDFY